MAVPGASPGQVVRARTGREQTLEPRGHDPTGDRDFIFTSSLTNRATRISRCSPRRGTKNSSAHVITPSNTMAGGRQVVRMHPACANKCGYTRNDKQLIYVRRCYQVTARDLSVSFRAVAVPVPSARSRG
jgi:hypothetical protein